MMGAAAKTVGAALALVVLVLGAHGFVDRIERDTEDRLAYRQWVADSCLPKSGERVIAINTHGKLHCTIYSRYERGITPIVISAAVMEVPQ